MGTDVRWLSASTCERAVEEMRRAMFSTGSMHGACVGYDCAIGRKKVGRLLMSYGGLVVHLW